MPKAKYLQIADSLRSQITSGQLAPGDVLPTEQELQDRFQAARNTVRNGVHVLVREGLVVSSQGKRPHVKLRETFVLDATRHEDLQFSTPGRGDSFNNDVVAAGRIPRQEFRVQVVKASQEDAERLQVSPGESAIQRFCLRYVDDMPLSTQSTIYPKWLVDEFPRLGEPDDIPEGTTRYLADRGVHQIGTRNRITTRMPMPEEARDLQVGPAGVPMMIWVRTGYTETRPVRCTTTVLRGDLNELNFDLGDLQALSREEEHLS